METRGKIGLRYGRKISIVEWLQFTFLAFLSFRVFETSIVFGMSCVNCIMHRRYCMFCQLFSLTEKKYVSSWCGRRSESSMKNITSVWWKSLRDYRFMDTALLFRLDWNMPKRDTLKGIQTNPKPKTYWILWIAICCTQSMIASVRGFSVTKNLSWTLRANFLSCLCHSFLWLVECILKLDKTRFIYK